MAKKTADVPETAAETPKKMKKSDAMREAIKRGIDKPQDASEFIKKEFGLDVTPQVFSSFKSISKKKGGISSGGRRGRRPAEGSAAVAAVAAVAAPSGQRVGNGSPVELAKTVRALVQQHGAAAVKGMVEVFE